MEFPGSENPEISRFWKLTCCEKRSWSVSAEGSSTNSPRSVTSRTSTQDGGTGGGILDDDLDDPPRWPKPGMMQQWELSQDGLISGEWIAIYPDPGWFYDDFRMILESSWQNLENKKWLRGQGSYQFHWDGRRGVLVIIYDKLVL